MTTSSSRTSQLTTAELALRCLTVTFTGAEGLSGGGEAPEPEQPLLRGPGPLSHEWKPGEGHATGEGKTKASMGLAHGPQFLSGLQGQAGEAPGLLCPGWAPQMATTGPTEGPGPRPDLMAGR